VKYIYVRVHISVYICVCLYVHECRKMLRGGGIIGKDILLFIWLTFMHFCTKYVALVI
jgi:hypothetical protein